MAKTKVSVFPLALVIIRKITSKGAELVRKRLLSLSSIPISPADLAEDCQWDVVFNIICENVYGVAGIPGSYVLPTHKFECVDISDEALVTMTHLIHLTGPIADVFLQMRSFTTLSVTLDEMPRGTELLGTLEQFEDPLIAIFDSLTAKIRYLNIPAVVPFGKSELDMIEERKPAGVHS